MYIIIWEYQVKPERVADFETIYGEHGAWTDLFERGIGYLGTEFLADPNNQHRYMTIDRWFSAQAYNNFLIRYQAEYEILDAECNQLTKSEILLGKWEVVARKTR